ncbi:DUF3592 domain-containing protein [Streptomyces sp. NPDC045431]|uniref:DUF3592 domain-containing protein n=1 Tax=Streptomyces sp. NPDC045431 TaxID=3155613 RepID=UPI0033F7923C
MEVPGGDHLFFGFMVALFGWLTVTYARRLAAVVRGVRGGERATGECVRVESEPYGRSDAERHFFAFRARDGRRVEFEDLAGRSVTAGTRVTVSYDPADPEGTATITGRGRWPTLVRYGVLVAGCGFGTAGFAVVFLLTWGEGR